MVMRATEVASNFHEHYHSTDRSREARRSLGVHLSAPKLNPALTFASLYETASGAAVIPKLHYSRQRRKKASANFSLSRNQILLICREGPRASLKNSEEFSRRSSVKGCLEYKLEHFNYGNENLGSSRFVFSLLSKFKIPKIHSNKEIRTLTLKDIA